MSVQADNAQRQLSVVVPTFRRTSSLRRLLDALRVQHGVELEIVVIDQNMPGTLPDEWLEGCVHLALAEPNVAMARNMGYLHASHRLVLFIDDDLIPDPDFCRRGVERFEQHPDIECLCPVIFAADEPVADAVRLLRDVATESRVSGQELIRIRSTISAAVFFRGASFVASGGFDPLLFDFAHAAEDQELFLRMAARAISVWADLTLKLRHDIAAPGGCDMRTVEYWTTRERCVRAWAFRHRAHGGHGCTLTAGALWHLARSAVLNRGALRAGPVHVIRHLAMLFRAIPASGRYLAPHASHYRSIDDIFHLGLVPGRAVPAAHVNGELVAPGSAEPSGERAAQSGAS